MQSHARKVHPAMSAQREGGSLPAVVVNFCQADLMGDGIDYTVRAPGGEPGWARKCEERNRTNLRALTPLLLFVSTQRVRHEPEFRDRTRALLAADATRPPLHFSAKITASLRLRTGLRFTK